MSRLTHREIDGVRYPRFGWSRCDRCHRYRLCYYSTPERAGFTLCYPCLGHAARLRPKVSTAPTAADILNTSTIVGMDEQGRTIMHSPLIGELQRRGAENLERAAASRDAMEEAERVGRIGTTFLFQAGDGLRVLFAAPGYEPYAPEGAIKLAEKFDGKQCHEIMDTHYHCAKCGGYAAVHGHMKGNPPEWACPDKPWSANA